ncbi:MAG: UDP-3-O-(3-hydroxymyristoyl)glucosamine N-acyltransferase [Myxococcota bacterium]
MSLRPIRLGDLAAKLGRELEGDGDVEIGGAAALESAGPGDLSFVRSRRFAGLLASSRAGAVIVPPGVDPGGRPAIRSAQPGLDFARAVRCIVPEPPRAAGVHPTAWIAPDARVDESAAIGPHCSVGARCAVGPRALLHANVSLYQDVTVGADCVLHAGCVLRERTALGERVVLQPGVVLGGDGFGYVANERGVLERVPQIGRVVVDDDVEIGANTTIDRGALGDTRVGRRTKIDNLVQVGHNCEIGEDVVIVAQVGLSGSTRVERGAMLMGQVGSAGHLTIGERAFVAGQSGLHRDVPPRARVMGTPAREERTSHRMLAALARLPELLGRVRAIERRLGKRDGGGD